MNVKENWFIVLILNILTLGIFSIYVAYNLNLYDKKAWYSNYKNWVLLLYSYYFQYL